MKRRFGGLAVIALLVPVLAACGKSDSTDTADESTTAPAATANTIDIAAQEYSWTAPTTGTAGVVTFNLTNKGKEPHAMSLARVDPGKGMADVIAALKSSDAPPPWVHLSGGGVQGPGGSTSYTTTLQAGTYVLFCPVPGPDGAPHFSKGMITQFELAAPPAGAPTALPSADNTVAARDFTWDGLDGLKSGSNTVKFTNSGKEDHEAAVFELAPGKTVDDLLKFFSSQGPPTGPPPFTNIPGLTTEVPPGQDAVTKIELKANTSYAVLCLVSNQKGPHFLQGMKKQIDIK